MTTLVTGATGTVGRHVVRELLARGEPVRALSRSEDPRLPPGVEVVRGDLLRPATVEPALEGVRALHLFPVPRTAHAVAGAARRHGVERIVVHSCGSAAHGDEHHLTVERAVEQAVPRWTHVRPYGMMADALQWAPDVRADGIVRASHARSSYPHVHEADVGAVAAAALLDDGHAGAVHLLSGPEAISRLDQARLIGAATGRRIGFDELDHDRALAFLTARGWPPDVVERELFVLGEFVDTPAPLGVTVADLLGRVPRTFAQWAVEHADAFRG